MKRLNKINTAAALMMGLMALSSCTDGQDWSVDSAFDRLFGTQDITVTPFDTKAAVAFGKTPNTTSYQVEVSTDSLYLDDVSSTSIVQTFTSSPDTIRGLMGETKYYLRMRSLCRRQESKPLGLLREHQWQSLLHDEGRADLP